MAFSHTITERKYEPLVLGMDGVNEERIFNLHFLLFPVPIDRNPCTPYFHNPKPQGLICLSLTMGMVT